MGRCSRDSRQVRRLRRDSRNGPSWAGDPNGPSRRQVPEIRNGVEARSAREVLACPRLRDREMTMSIFCFRELYERLLDYEDKGPHQDVLLGMSFKFKDVFHKSFVRSLETKAVGLSLSSLSSSAKILQALHLNARAKFLDQSLTCRF